jgi:hypothetical protein
MKKRALTFDDVAAVGLALPGVDTGTSYGSPALKAHGRVLACLASNKQADPDSLYVSLDFPARDELVEAAPDTYYLRDHYVPWPCVLVRLNRISADALRDLLAMSYAYLASNAAKRKRRRR